MRLALRIRRFARSAPWRRAIAASALVAFALAATGFPLPQFTATSGGPFICQHRGCGCTSAEQCWKSCCCFSLAERVAWAKQNRITPPKFVLAQLERGRTAAKASCCSHKAAQSSSCCSAAKKKSCCSHVAKTASPAGKRITWVSTIAAQKCRGLTSSWSALNVPIYPPPACVNFALETPHVETLAVCDARACCMAYKILTPPG